MLVPIARSAECFQLLEKYLDPDRTGIYWASWESMADTLTRMGCGKGIEAVAFRTCLDEEQKARVWNRVEARWWDSEDRASEWRGEHSGVTVGKYGIS